MIKIFPPSQIDELYKKHQLEETTDNTLTRGEFERKLETDWDFYQRWVKHSLVKLTKEQVYGYKDFLTVGKLKQYLEKYGDKFDDDAPVLIQRIEDFYYENNHWGVYIKPSDISNESQYHPAWCCLQYKDETALFIDLHY